MVGEDDHGQAGIDKARHTGGKACPPSTKIDQFVAAKILHHPRYKFSIGQDERCPEFILLDVGEDLTVR